MHNIVMSPTTFYILCLFLVGVGAVLMALWVEYQLYLEEKENNRVYMRDMADKPAFLRRQAD